jgi:hypothetical protein
MPRRGYANRFGIRGSLRTAEPRWRRQPHFPDPIQRHVLDSLHCTGIFIQHHDRPPGFLDFITVWPTGQARPNASTLNGYVNTVIANAAIVPAGTSGSVDVYANQNTNLIIDINGYYAAQSGITLAQGTAVAPSLSFSADAGTGIFSPGAGTVNIATSGTSRLSARFIGRWPSVTN